MPIRPRLVNGLAAVGTVASLGFCALTGYGPFGKANTVSELPASQYQKRYESSVFSIADQAIHTPRPNVSCLTEHPGRVPDLIDGLVRTSSLRFTIDENNTLVLHDKNSRLLFSLEDADVRDERAVAAANAKTRRSKKSIFAYRCEGIEGYLALWVGNRPTNFLSRSLWWSYRIVTTAGTMIAYVGSVISILSLFPPLRRPVSQFARTLRDSLKPKAEEVVWATKIYLITWSRSYLASWLSRFLVDGRQH